MTTRPSRRPWVAGSTLAVSRIPFGSRCGTLTRYIREVSSIADAREVVRRSFSPTVFEPGDSAAWQEARERFTQFSAAARAGSPEGARA